MGPESKKADLVQCFSELHHVLDPFSQPFHTLITSLGVNPMAALLYLIRRLHFYQFFSCACFVEFLHRIHHQVATIFFSPGIHEPLEEGLWDLMLSKCVARPQL